MARGHPACERHHDEQMYGGETGERERNRVVHLLWKEAELKTQSTVRNKPSGTVVMSGPLLRVMSGPVVLQQMGIMLPPKVTWTPGV